MATLNTPKRVSRDIRESCSDIAIMVGLGARKLEPASTALRSGMTRRGHRPGDRRFGPADRAGPEL